MNTRNDKPNDAGDEAGRDWTARARELLDESAASLDAATASRLNRARQRALEQRTRTTRPWWLPAGAATAASLLLAVVVANHLSVPVTAPSPPEVVAGSGDDAELIAADDDLDLAQDLEFYAWLDAEDEHNG